MAGRAPHPLSKEVAMEYGLRFSRVRALPSDPRDICEAQWRGALPPGSLRGLYFGTEFCEDLLPGEDEAESFCILARETGIEAILLTPVVTPSGLRQVARLLTGLERRGWSPTVTFNDWGVLKLLRESFPQLVRKAGRLINRGIRDPRLTQAAPNPGAMTDNKGDKLRSLLLRHGVTGVETDPDLDGLYLSSEASGLQRVLHLPYTFAASGRNCLIKAEVMDAEKSFSKGLGHGCSAPCRERCHPVKRADTEVPLWRAGNTLFYQVSKASAEVHMSRCDRIVLHERPMP